MMERFMLKSKIHRMTVTGAELNYEGSIAIDETLLKAADILPGEKVEILNLNNGSRIETYAIAAPSGSGEVCLNGPAARSGVVGDLVIVVAYACVPEPETGKWKARIVHVDGRNRIKN